MCEMFVMFMFEDELSELICFGFLWFGIIVFDFILDCIVELGVGVFFIF